MNFLKVQDFFFNEAVRQYSEKNNGDWDFLTKQMMHRPSTPSDLSGHTGPKFKKGATVGIIKNQTLFQQFMEYEDNIPKDVEEILGKKVEIVQIFVDGDYGIKYKNKTFVINEKCISRSSTEQKWYDSSSDSDSDENMNILILAICSGNLDQVSAVVNSTGPNIKINNSYPIIIATKNGHLHIINFLIGNKADLSAKDEDGYTALHCAVTKNHLEICSLLVENGADVNALSNEKLTPIMLAAYLGHVDILKLVAGHKEADMVIKNANKQTALHMAIENSEIECVETLLDKAFRPNAARTTENIPFHYAAMKEDERLLKLFLKRYGASIINIQDEMQRAAIHFAVSHNQIQCLKLLIKYKADINIQNFMMQTPLHLAVFTKNLNCVKVLVENKAELDIMDLEGFTPLHLGMRGKYWDLLNTFSSEIICNGPDKYEDIVLYLAKAGASLDIRDKDGTSPVDECDDTSLKRKLLAIRDERRTRQAKEMSTSKSKNVAVTKSAMEELNELRQTVKQMRDEVTCKLCYERRRSTVFGCGHMACEVCANDLSECRLCNFKFGLQIRILD